MRPTITKAELLNMELHAVWKDWNGMTITRTIGGWIYTFDYIELHAISSVFIPEEINVEVRY